LIYLVFGFEFKYASFSYFSLWFNTICPEACIGFF
jgi:hypothetical protein